MTTKRKPIPVDVMRLVLHEAGYKCANPVCRHPLTLDVHHLDPVSDGGANTTDNLVALCPNCHALHHREKVIPTSSLRAWKMLLLALNEAYDRSSIDVLLALDKQGCIERLTGDGIVGLAPLIASGLADIDEHRDPRPGLEGGHSATMYRVRLSSKGKALVGHWKRGDQVAAVSTVGASGEKKQDQGPSAS